MNALPKPFIVGVARSGTTLLRFMLDRHPSLSILPETHFIPALIDLYPPDNPPSRAGFLAFLTSHYTWPEFGLSADEFERVLASKKAHTLTEYIRTFYEMYAQQNGKTNWGDKTPPYVEHIRVIAQLLPEACFIHIIRDGRAVASSRRYLNFGPGSDISDQAEDWVRKIRSAREQATKCTRYIEVHYEDLIATPRETLMKICDYLGIDYSPSLLDYRSSAPSHLERFHDWRSPRGDVLSAADYRRAIHQRTLEPLDRNRIGHWRKTLTPLEIADFEATAGDLLMELGYSLLHER